MDFLPGDVAFVMHWDNWMSKAISWFTQIPGLPRFSHTVLIVESAPDRTYTSETSDYESTIGWIERYTTDPNVYMEVWRLPDMTDGERATAVMRGLSQQETVYPYWQLLSLAIRGILKKIGIHIGNILPWGYDCNEHVHYSLLKTHYPELANTEPHSLDNLDFYKLYTGISGAQKIYTKQVGQ